MAEGEAIPQIKIEPSPVQTIEESLHVTTPPMVDVQVTDSIRKDEERLFEKYSVVKDNESAALNTPSDPEVSQSTLAEGSTLSTAHETGPVSILDEKLTSIDGEPNASPSDSEVEAGKIKETIAQLPNSPEASQVGFDAWQKLLDTTAYRQPQVANPLTADSSKDIHSPLAGATEEEKIASAVDEIKKAAEYNEIIPPSAQATPKILSDKELDLIQQNFSTNPLVERGKVGKVQAFFQKLNPLRLFQKEHPNMPQAPLPEPKLP